MARHVMHQTAFTGILRPKATSSYRRECHCIETASQLAHLLFESLQVLVWYRMLNVAVYHVTQVEDGMQLQWHSAEQRGGTLGHRQ